MSFSKKIKCLREQKSLTQQELADIIGVAQPTVAQYEMGTKLPSIVVGVRLAKALGTTSEELVEEFVDY